MVGNSVDIISSSVSILHSRSSALQITSSLLSLASSSVIIPVPVVLLVVLLLLLFVVILLLPDWLLWPSLLLLSLIQIRAPSSGCSSLRSSRLLLISLISQFLLNTAALSPLSLIVLLSTLVVIPLTRSSLIVLLVIVVISRVLVVSGSALRTISIGVTASIHFINYIF